MPLLSCLHWVFDMDGPLTQAAHDFDAIRTELGVPQGKPALESIAELPTGQAVFAHRRLAEIELQIAQNAIAQEGAKELLAHLRQRGAEVGILTRNTNEAAQATLDSAGLAEYFEAESIIARETFAPKPNPEGLLYLVKHWNITAASAVMVGDYLYDLQAGKGAGAVTVHLDISGQFPWPEFTDFSVSHLAQLLNLAGA